MNLSEEQKQRIRQEEEQRLVEERYRQQVRSELRATPSTGTSVSQRRPIRGIALGAFAATLVVACVLWAALAARFKPRAFEQQAVRADAPAMAANPSIAADTKPLPYVAPPPAPTPLTTSQIAQMITPSVVVIENFGEDGERASTGSGFVYSTENVVVTNYHVVRGARTLSVRQLGKDPLSVDRLLGYSIGHDLALVQLPSPIGKGVEVDDSEKLAVGEHVVAVGAPLGLEDTVSEGIVSALRDAGGVHVIQTTASISPGSSGGPLLNEFGKVIGVTTATMAGGQNLNLAISAKYVTQLLRERKTISLPDLLAQTLVEAPLLTTSFSVPARQVVTLRISVQQQGATLEGDFQVTGGFRNDIGVVLRAQDGRVISNSGKVVGRGQFNNRLSRGVYELIFDNSFSVLSAKTISSNLKLRSYR